MKATDYEIPKIPLTVNVLCNGEGVAGVKVVVIKKDVGVVSIGTTISGGKVSFELPVGLYLVECKNVQLLETVVLKSRTEPAEIWFQL